MSTNEEIPAIVQSLAPAISICTLLVSIGSYITPHYFVITIVVLVILMVFVQMFPRVGNKDNELEMWVKQQLNEKRAAKRSQGTVPVTKISTTTHIVKVRRKVNYDKTGTNVQRNQKFIERVSEEV